MSRFKVFVLPALAVLLSGVTAPLLGQGISEKIRIVETGVSIPQGDGVAPLELDLRELMQFFTTQD